MSNKRPLTADEKTMAARIKAAIGRNPDLTEEIVGERLGVTQGQVSHWTGGRLPVPARRAAALADALGIHDPSEISAQYRAVAGHKVREPAPDYVLPPAESIASMRQELDAMRALLATMIIVSTEHRPTEAADVAKRLRRHLPTRLRRGFVDEVLATLEDSLHPDRVSARRPRRSDAANR